MLTITSLRRVTSLRHVATFVAIMLVAPACSFSDTSPVAIVGDSITSLGQPTLEADFGSRYDLTITGQFGFTVAQVMPAAELVAAEPQDQVIINLGTNDVIGKLDIAESIATYQSMIDLFDSASCIHLVNINEHLVDLRNGEVLTEQAQKYNAALETLAASDGRINIIDWRKLTNETLSTAKPPVSTLTQDSIHPNDEGNVALNKLYEAALNSC